jgi:hypothetical protein
MEREHAKEDKMRVATHVQFLDEKICEVAAKKRSVGVKYPSTAGR